MGDKSSRFERITHCASCRLPAFKVNCRSSPLIVLSGEGNHCDGVRHNCILSRLFCTDAGEETERNGEFQHCPSNHSARPIHPDPESSGSRQKCGLDARAQYRAGTPLERSSPDPPLTYKSSHCRRDRKSPRLAVLTADYVNGASCETSVQGKRSSMRLMGWLAIRASTSRKYASGSMPFRLAEQIRRTSSCSSDQVRRCACLRERL